MAFEAGIFVRSLRVLGASISVGNMQHTRTSKPVRLTGAISNWSAGDFVPGLGAVVVYGRISFIVDPSVGPRGLSRKVDHRHDRC